MSDVRNLTMGCLTETQLLIAKYKKQKDKHSVLLRTMNKSIETLFSIMQDFPRGRSLQGTVQAGMTGERIY